MPEKKAKSRRRRILLGEISSLFKIFATLAFVTAALAGYVSLRVERTALGYAVSENALKESALIEEVAAAQVRFNRLVSGENLAKLARQRGFREPRRADFIYESPAPGDGGKAE